MRKCLLFFVIITAILSSLNSCKKEDVEQKTPEIEVDSPLPNQNYSYGNTIQVNGLVTHNQNLRSIKIGVYDANKDVECIPAISFQNTGNSYTIHCMIELNNRLMEDGLYYVGVVAHDGLYIKKHYVPFHYISMPRKKLGILFLTKTTSNQTRVSLIDTLNYESVLFSTYGDNCVSEMVCKYNQLIFAGAYYGSLVARNIEDRISEWEVPNQSDLLQPWFKCLYYNNNTLYAATQNNVITGYSMNGLPVKSYQCNSGWSANELLEYDGRFFAVVENLGYQIPQIAQFYSASGQFISQQPLSFTTLKMFPKAPGELMIFGFEGYYAKAYTFYFTENNYQTTYNFGTKSIIDVVDLGSNHYLVLTTTEVLLFNSAPGGNATPLCYTTNGKQLLVDITEGTFLVVKDNQIMVFNLTSGEMETIFYTNNTINKAHLYYNR